MGVAWFILMAIGTVFIGALGQIVANEYQGLAAPLSEWLVKRAAKRLPPPYREAYKAEWLQLIADLPTPTTKLANALSLLARVGSIQAAIEMPSVSPSTTRLIRFLDFWIAAVWIFLLLPLLVVITLLVKLESSGPVMFKQARIGQKGKRIYFLKFRTMRIDEHAIQRYEDVRITYVGRWLRRTSLDLLPNLINVLNGTMSLVGPRPKHLDEPEDGTSEFRPGLFTKEPAALASKYSVKFYLKAIVEGLAKGLRTPRA